MGTRTQRAFHLSGNSVLGGKWQGQSTEERRAEGRPRKPQMPGAHYL
jgi:hypothetical protein